MRTSSTFVAATARRTALAAALALVGAVGAASRASADDRPIPPAPPPPPAPLDSPAEPTGPGPLAPPDAAPHFTREQLVELVGPIALYPDPVLSSLLPATAFPLDVVAAARWVRENGPDATPTPEQLQGWDPSVQALVQFPDVLLWLDQNLPWLEQMGAAVANQQGEVMAAIQDFRRKAKDAGNLRSDEHQSVVVQPVPEQPEVEVIVIEPATPSVVYVPYYDPYAVCYPTWGAPYYGFGWSLGFTFGSWGPWCHYDIGWGWWDWHSHHFHGCLSYHSQPHYWFHRNVGTDPAVTFRPRSTVFSHSSTTWSHGGQVTRVHAATRPSWSDGSHTTFRRRGDVVASTGASTGLRPRTWIPSTPAPKVLGAWNGRANGAGDAGAASQGFRSFARRFDGATNGTHGTNGGASNGGGNGTPWRTTNFPRFRTDGGNGAPTSGTPTVTQPPQSRRWTFPGLRSDVGTTPGQPATGLSPRSWTGRSFGGTTGNDVPPTQPFVRSMPRVDSTPSFPRAWQGGSERPSFQPTWQRPSMPQLDRPPTPQVERSVPHFGGGGGSPHFGGGSMFRRGRND